MRRLATLWISAVPHREWNRAAIDPDNLSSIIDWLTLLSLNLIIIIIMVSFYIPTYNALCAPHLTPLVTGPVYSCTILTLFLEHTALAAISALGTNHTHCHLCPTRYSFTPESSGAYEGKLPCPRTQHQNNVPILRGEKHVISLKILHQAGF